MIRDLRVLYTLHKLAGFVRKLSVFWGAKIAKLFVGKEIKNFIFPFNSRIVSAHLVRILGSVRCEA